MFGNVSTPGSAISFERKLGNDHGVSLISVMFALSLLAVFGLVAAGLAVNERRTAFNDLTHSQSFVAADSGGEAAIAWLMATQRPPKITNMATREVRAAALTGMDTSSYQDYAFTVRMRPDPTNPGLPMIRPRPGYEPGRYMDFFYDVDADGEAGVEARSSVSVIVTKLTQLNYN